MPLSSGRSPNSCRPDWTASGGPCNMNMEPIFRVIVFHCTAPWAELRPVPASDDPHLHIERSLSFMAAGCCQMSAVVLV